MLEQKIGALQVTQGIEQFRKSLLGPRMGLIVDLKYVLDGKLSVALSGGKTLVAEHLLNRAQVSAFLQQVGPKRMSQRVRMNVRRQAFGNRDFLDDPPHA